MVVIPGSAPDKPSEERGPTFTGRVWADPVLPGTDGVAITSIFFEPSAHTFWHYHEAGQILHVVAGIGLVRAEGGEAEVIRAGDVVWTPPGERHWHGATPRSFVTHLSISLGTTVWGEEVADGGYPESDLDL